MNLNRKNGETNGTEDKTLPKGLEKCDKCQFVEKGCGTDSWGNITIVWTCYKRGISLFYKVVRGDKYLERFSWLNKEDVSMRENLDKCEEYMPKSHGLGEYPKSE